MSAELVVAIPSPAAAACVPQRPFPISLTEAGWAKAGATYAPGKVRQVAFTLQSCCAKPDAAVGAVQVPYYGKTM